MKQIIIGNQLLNIKDYYCDNGSGYAARDDGKLWLYVNVTDVCNGKCPFCINPSRSRGSSHFEIASFRNTLNRIKPFVYGVSLTGGEPMLETGLIDEILSVVRDISGDDIEIDMVTNGIHFDQILQLKQLEALTAIHVSRHQIKDDDNNQLFGFETAGSELLKSTISKMKDPGMIVFNCALIKGNIDSPLKMAEYLKFAADLNVQNTSFIALSVCNDYCRKHYVDPAEFNLSEIPGFHIWNTLKDHDYCRCSSGSYEAQSRRVRFYYRCIGTTQVQYTRQLVYTADNRLLAGFNGKEILFND